METDMMEIRAASLSYSSSTTRGQDCEERLRCMERRRYERKMEEINIGWFFWLQSNYPSIIIGLCLVLTGIVTTINIFFIPTPDFTEPSKGFEVRGTELSTKLITWRKLTELTDSYCRENRFSTLPCREKYKVEEKVKKPKKTKKSKKQKRSKKRRKNKNNRRKGARSRRDASGDVIEDSTSFNMTSLEYYDDNMTSQYSVRDDSPMRSVDEWNFTKSYFCQNPRASQPRWVFEAKNGDNLWTLRNVRSMCQLQSQLLDHVSFRSECNHGVERSCCPALSLPNFIARLSGTNTCMNLTQEGLDVARAKVEKCAPFYRNGQLKSYCHAARNQWTFDSCSGEIPKECIADNAVYSLLHYVIDNDSSNSLNNNLYVSKSMTYLPMETYREERVVRYYFDKFNGNLQDGDVRVSSVDLKVKGWVFAQQLQYDVIYPVIAAVFVVALIVLYSGSVFLTLSCVLVTVMAMSTSYLVYHLFLGLRFFPFLNLTAVLVMLGIGADNVILYVSIWQQCASDDRTFSASAFHPQLKLKRDPPEHRMGVVARNAWMHASKSLGVTGITTGVAFLSNASSQVTAVKCFAIYTGVAVICNLLITLLLLPAAVLFHHKHLGHVTYAPKSGKHRNGAWKLVAKVRRVADDFYHLMVHSVHLLFVVRFRWVGVCLCAAATSFCLYALLWQPGVQLPSSSGYEDFQYFVDGHKLQKFAGDAKKFPFRAEMTRTNLSVRVVFGIENTDHAPNHRFASYLDPDLGGGEVLRVRGSNLTSRQSQRWLMNFCSNVRKLPFLQTPPSDDSQLWGNYLNRCEMEKFEMWTRRKCEKGDSHKCCEVGEFPMAPHIFDECVKEAVVRVDRAQRRDSWSPGPRFDHRNLMRVLILEFPTNVSTDRYDVIEDFYERTNNEMQRLLKGAPRGLKQGWFLPTNMQMYSLQRALLLSTKNSLLLSLIVAVIVVALSTNFNLIVTFFSCLTISSVVVTVMGSMCLMGWQLNVMESVVLSIGVGLSVDFTSHVAIAYLLAPDKSNRHRRVEHVLTKLSGALLCAMCTTFIAGLGLVTSSIIAYRRFGVFLMLTTSVSWAYSNYFFCGLLAAFGPQNENCPIDQKGCGLLCCCCQGDHRNPGSERSGRGVATKTTFMTHESSSLHDGGGGHHPQNFSSQRVFPPNGHSSQSTLAPSLNFQVVERSTLI